MNLVDMKNVSPSVPHRMRQTSPAMYRVGLSMLLISFPTLLLAWADPRTLQGVSVWVKPWKFQVASGLYLLTLLLFMVWLPKQALRSYSIRYVVWAAIGASAFEVIYITLQGARGLPSHFNTSELVYVVMYQLMGFGAVVLTSASLVLGVVIARSAEYALPPALKLSIVLGLLVTFTLGTGFGAYLGGQMQGHWVGGVKSDTDGLPLFGWARDGGDLRVAHFFGIHAMHFIAAWGAFLSMAKVPQRFAGPAVWGFSAAFSALCVGTFVQAVGGRPFLAALQ